VQLPLSRRDLNWDEESFLQFAAVNADRIDFIGRVRACDVAPRRVPGTPYAYADNAKVTVQRTPFALHSEQAVPAVKNEVVATMLRHRLEDIDAQLDGRQGDRGLGDVALVVGSEHLPILARRM
jgi:hypothetical protein